MNAFYRISSIIVLYSLMILSQLMANEVTKTEVSMAYPCINVGSMDFGEVLVNQAIERQGTIFNQGSSLLTITGYSYENGNADGVFGTSLGEISPEKPLTIMAGEAVTFTVKFTPKEMKNYSDKIIFESDAEETCADHDPILELNARGTNLLIEPLEDVIINMNSFTDVPIKTNSTKPSALVFTPKTGDSGIISIDSMLITGSNNNYNLKLIPKKDKIGVLYISIGVDDGIRKGSTDCKVTVIDAGAVKEIESMDNAIFISPNPANNSSISIKYNLEDNCNVLLSLYNSNGMLIRNLLNTFQISGYQTFTLSVDELPAGIYFVEFRAGGVVGHKNFVVVK
jgi:hypothetical protein